MFDTVTTIEWSGELHARAEASNGDLTNVTFLHGNSAEVLPQTVRANAPGLYFLDGHWSGDITAGEEFECPVLAEIAALEAGHADDCVVIDDARLFIAPPPPPHKAEQRPTLIEVFDALRAVRPDHHTTVLDDQVFAVPRAARPVLDEFGQSLT